MRLPCPNCKKLLTVSDKATGQKDICPHCFKAVDTGPPQITSNLLKWKTAFSRKYEEKLKKEKKN